MKLKNIIILSIFIVIIAIASIKAATPLSGGGAGTLHNLLTNLHYNTANHIGFANATGMATVSFRMNNMNASGNARIDGDLVVGGVLTAAGSSIASPGSIPNNASFTLNGLSEKDYQSLTGKPTSASWTFNDLLGIPSNASYTLNGLSEKIFGNLDGKPTNASYTLNDLSEKLFSSLTGQPTNASYTLSGLSEKIFGNLDGQPTNASYAFNGLSDAPSRTGNANKVLTVNAGENGYDWTTATGLSSHSLLFELDFSSSGHTGFASSGAIPNNASFTLNGLAEKDFHNLTGKPTSASYTFSGLSDIPTYTSNMNKYLQLNASGTELQWADNFASGTPVIRITGNSTATTSSLILTPARSDLMTVGLNKSMIFTAEIKAEFANGFGSGKLFGTMYNQNGTVGFVGDVASFTNFSDSRFTITASYSASGELRFIASGPSNLELDGYVITSNLIPLLNAAGSILDATPCGGMITWTASSVPSNYLLCDGSEYASSSYPDLYAVIGTNYNTGGETAGGYFRVPDMRGVYAKGMGQNGILGANYTGASGTPQVDIFQTHSHNVFGSQAGSGALGQRYTTLTNDADNISLQSEFRATTLLTGRSGNITEPANVGVWYIIKATKAIGSNQVDMQVNNLTVAGTITASSAPNTPVGTVIMYDGIATDTGLIVEPEPGWLLENGATCSRTIYAALFAKIGTKYNTGGEEITHFRLPDRRGVFPKGYGQNGKLGSNYSNASATPQTDAFQGHTHYASNEIMTAGGTERYFTVGGTVGENNSTGYDAIGGPYTFSTYGTPRIGNVTEPANVGTNYLIKY